jgi:hypothetical protein
MTAPTIVPVDDELEDEAEETDEEVAIPSLSIVNVLPSAATVRLRDHHPSRSVRIRALIYQHICAHITFSKTPPEARTILRHSAPGGRSDAVGLDGIDQYVRSCVYD